MNPVMPSEEMTKRVVHPCDQWALGAQQQSWADALLAMKGGAVLCGPAPSMGKSTLNVILFFDQVRAEGLHAWFTEFDQVFLGLKENFSASMLACQEEEAAQVVRPFNPLA